MSNLFATLIGLLSLLGLTPSSGVVAPRTPLALERPPSDSVRAAAADDPLPTAGEVDLRRYAGTWYELARLPVRFQDAASVSTATYAVRADGLVSVDNASYVGDERGYRIRGTAQPVEPGRNDRLRVRFGGFLRAIPVPKEGNYWIIEVEPDYSMALVGTPDRRFLWLLARDGERFDASTAQAMLRRAAELGFDTDRLSLANWKTRTMHEA